MSEPDAKDEEPTCLEPLGTGCQCTLVRNKKRACLQLRGMWTDALGVKASSSAVP